uniref:Uncharacterized protein n=1 Tax=Providencia alcalifaciens TaxID=126385 RepID=H7C8G3_9GAMM|nr:hypothetical protein [Providencia alcalifaciens]
MPKFGWIRYHNSREVTGEVLTVLKQAYASWQSSSVCTRVLPTYAKTNLGGYCQGRDYRQLSYDVSGGLLIHSGGVTPGLQLGQTSVLVATSGEEGIMLENGYGAKTDWQGYAISPWGSEYQDNRIALDAAKLDDEIDIGLLIAHVIPSKKPSLTSHEWLLLR